MKKLNILLIHLISIKMNTNKKEKKHMLRVIRNEQLIRKSTR